MSIFDSIKIYVPMKWQVKNSRSFSPEEIEGVQSAVIVDSEYGSSVCFTMVSGGKGYIPVSRDCNANVGDTVDLSKARLLTLSREGDADIFRVEI